MHPEPDISGGAHLRASVASPPMVAYGCLATASTLQAIYMKRSLLRLAQDCCGMNVRQIKKVSND